MEISAKIRYSQSVAKGKVFPIGKDRVVVEFNKPQRAPTQGQAAVLYDGDYVVGGGTIDEI